jgi:hypothetical protein
MAQLPNGIPTLLLRGVIGPDLIAARNELGALKQNVVLFSGTHIASNGVAELIEGWRDAQVPDWELHITGYGQLTDTLRGMAHGVRGVVFHGLVSRAELVRLMCSAKICINPHQVSRTPGNVFAFKIIEYLAAGGHVMTTPMGTLEPELEVGISYMPANSPATIAACLKEVIRERRYDRSSAVATERIYGPDAVSRSLQSLLGRAMTRVMTPVIAS